MPSIEELEAFASHTYDHLLGVWPNIHKSLGYEVPDIPSTHLCRESSTLTLMMLEALGQTGWEIEYGQINFDENDDIPLDITDIEGYGVADENITSTPHVWLVNEKLDVIIDISADQFGSFLIPSGQGALTSKSEDLYHSHQVADTPQDWSNDTQIVGVAEFWFEEACRDDDFIAAAQQALGLPAADLVETRSIAPRSLRAAIQAATDEGISQCQPDTPEGALATINLLGASAKAFDLTPRPTAKSEAVDIFENLIDHIAGNWTGEPSKKEELIHRMRSEATADGNAPVELGTLKMG